MSRLKIWLPLNHLVKTKSHGVRLVCFTHYRRKWDSIQRQISTADPILKTSRFPLYWVRTRCFCYPPAEAVMVCQFPCNHYQFGGSLFWLFLVFIGIGEGLLLHAGFCYLISRLPQRSRLTLLGIKTNKEEVWRNFRSSKSCRNVQNENRRSCSLCRRWIQRLRLLVEKQLADRLFEPIVKSHAGIYRSSQRIGVDQA